MAFGLKVELDPQKLVQWVSYLRYRLVADEGFGNAVSGTTEYLSIDFQP